MPRRNDQMVSSIVQSRDTGYDEDAPLVARFLSGENAAFDEIYARYRDRVYVISKGILLDADDAADATQETFSLILKNLHRFGHRSKLSTWIFRVAINSAIQYSRKLKYRNKHIKLEEAINTPVPEAERPLVDEERVKVALSKLKPDDRAVLSLFYWENLSLIEIGEALKCGANAAKTRLYRARERFRREYEKIMENEK